ncbi:MAG: 4-hydroxy-3-methylbut-2-enyl diphosphate reductase [Thermoleophilia bacterium]|nr:4-hydroxy-3-methylbut-2-enyl diphosphate reductase [Thermoleophilia bacterium]
MGELEIIISEYAGFCWGVKRALELTLEAAKQAPAPINTLGPLIHNPGVIEDLRSRGVGVIASPDQIAQGTVILRSHGVPKEIRELLANSSLTVVDATCPFVAAAQEKAQTLREAGYLVVILGEKDHPEVLGLRSYAGPESLVVESAEDIPLEFQAARVGVVVQTTQSQERLAELAAALAPRVRELLVHNTICSATELRQRAAAALAASVDVVIVIGGRESGNTRRLAELCAATQPRTYHVETPSEIQREWLVGARRVGITAGASTPPEQVQAAQSRIRELDP